MEIKKQNITILATKSEAVNQLTFDEDFNVPDSKPDVRRIIQKKGEIRIEEVEVTEGKAKMKGMLHFCLLYVADAPVSQVSSLEGDLPVSETVYLNGLQNGDKVCVKWEIEDISFHIINSRKLNIKAIAEFHASVDEEKEAALPGDVSEEPGLSVKKNKIRLLTLAVRKRDTMRQKENIIIPSDRPNIREVIWKDMHVKGIELRAENGKVLVKGELCVFVLYEGEPKKGENLSMQWYESTLPLNGEVTCSGCSPEMIPYIETTMMHTGLEVKPDVDGEERILQAEITLELDIKIYREEEYSILQDVYSLQKECIPVRENVPVEQLLIRNNAKCRVNDKISLKEAKGNVLQICHSDGDIKIDTIQMVKDGVEVEGIVKVRILYCIPDDEMPFYSMETTMPFTHVLEAKEINSDCVIQMQADMEQISTTMLDSSDVEVKAEINLNALICKKWEESLIQDVQVRELDMEMLEQMPGIVCYVVQQGDTLWDIARMFYTTVESIVRVNELESEELKEQQMLLLIKNADGSTNQY